MSKKQKQSTEEQEQEIVWKEIFSMFDKDKNGQICREELGTVLRALDMDPTKAELDEALKALDKNGDGTIEYEDFRHYMMKQKKSTRDERKNDMLRAFRLMDKNNDKFIDSKELMQVLTSLGEPLTEEEVMAMIRVADVNKDGKIDYEEFVDFIIAPCLEPMAAKRKRSSSSTLHHPNKYANLNNNDNELQPLVAKMSTSSNQSNTSKFFFTANQSGQTKGSSETISDMSLNSSLPVSSQGSIHISDMNANVPDRMDSSSR